MLDDILDRLGGEQQVASFMGCGQSAVSNWKVRGIPKARWVDLLILAREQDVPLQLDDIEAADRAIREGGI